jgi:DnaJ-class molecular chaperone
MAKRDYYEIIGVARGAGDEEIRAAYRRLARKYHPDLNPGNKQAEQNFKELGEAYEALSDPKKRKLYDQFGADGLRAGAQAGPGGGPGPGAGFGGRPGGSTYTWSGEGSPFDDVSFEAFGGGPQGDGSIFEDIIAQMSGMHGSRGGGRSGRGRGRGRAGPQRGQDAESAIEISFEQAALGIRTAIGLQRPAADGSIREQRLEVRIPPGVEDGQRLRLSGQGGDGAGGPPGDLYLAIRVRPHAYLRREGRDIYVDVPISLSEAALGGSVEVPTLSGRSTVRVPPGTASGMKLRLKGQGIAGPHGEEKGDQYCVIRIVPPRSPGDRQKQLFEELRGLETEDPRADAPWNREARQS